MKFLLAISIICFCSLTSIAQSLIGASYGLRVFPLQKHGTYYYYDKDQYFSDPYSVTLSAAPEHSANFFFELPIRSEKRTLRFGLNTYTGTFDFKTLTSDSYGGAGVGGSGGTYNTFTKKGTYHYSFVGLEFGTTHYHKLSSGGFSFIRGISASANVLVYEKTSDKESISFYHSSETIYSGPNAGTYSFDSTSRTSNVADIKNKNPFNIKLEVFLGFSYRLNENLFSFTTAVGISSQSRIYNDPSRYNFNLYLCPRFSYTRSLQKKAK